MDTRKKASQTTDTGSSTDAVIRFLTQRGMLGDRQIDDEKVREIKQQRTKNAYHNTLLLLKHYRTISWLLECFPDTIAQELDQPFDRLDKLIDRLDVEIAMGMEEYFPFVSKAFTVMQYTAWAILFLITVWQLFRSLSGPIAEAENPWTLLIRGSLFAILIGFAKPIFLYVLKIAKAPYSALMDLPMGSENFTFAGVENVLKNGLIKQETGESSGRH